MSHPYLNAHEFQIPAPSGDFQPARWTVVPAGAGTMCRHAGRIGERRLPGSPLLGYLVRFDGFRIVSGPDQRRQYMVFIARAGTGSSTRPGDRHLAGAGWRRRFRSGRLERFRSSRLERFRSGRLERFRLSRPEM
jgi:hypothetical protein